MILVILQTFAASTKSFSEDETWTVTISQMEADAILQVDRHVHPPLHYFVSAFWHTFAGRSEIAMRWLSISCAALTLVLGTVLARRWFGQPAAIAFALLLSVWPLFITYAHNARYYAWSTLLCLVALLCVDNHLHTWKVRWLAAYTLVGIFMLYTVCASVVMLLGCWLWWLMGWRTQTRQRSRLLYWIAANLAIALVFLPWLPVFLGAMQYNVTVSGAGDFIAEFVKRGALLVYGFFVGETISPLNPIAFAVAMVVLVLSILTLRRASYIAVRLLIVSLVVTVCAVVIAAASRSSSLQNITNRSLFLMPLYVMWVAYCLTCLPRRVAIVAGLVLVASYGIALFNYLGGREFMKPALTVPWRGIMQTVKASSQPDTAVICTDDYACNYYADQYGFKPYAASDWPSIMAKKPHQVWWIISNVSTRPLENIGQALDAARAQYASLQTFNFARQDASVRAFKRWVFGADVYEYRIYMLQFSQPHQTSISNPLNVNGHRSRRF